MGLSARLVHDGVPRLSGRNRVVTAERDRIIRQRPFSNEHSTTTPPPKKGYLTDFERRKRIGSHVHSEIEQGILEYLDHSPGSADPEGGCRKKVWVTRKCEARKCDPYFFLTIEWRLGGSLFNSIFRGLFWGALLLNPTLWRRIPAALFQLHRRRQPPEIF